MHLLAIAGSRESSRAVVQAISIACVRSSPRRSRAARDRLEEVIFMAKKKAAKKKGTKKKAAKKKK